MKKLISLIAIVVLFNGCLTPYDNQFTCKPTVIGKCSTSIIKSYDETLNSIETKEKENENIN